MKQRKTNKKEANEASLDQLLDQVEAEMNRLRAEIRQLREKPLATAAQVAAEKTVTEEAKVRRTARPQALGKGLSQLFGGPKRG